MDRLARAMYGRSTACLREDASASGKHHWTSHASQERIVFREPRGDAASSKARLAQQQHIGAGPDAL